MSQNGPKGILRLFGKHNNEENLYEEEIKNILSEGHEQGVIEKEEAEMITKIFEFGDKDAKDIMTIRKKIVGVEQSVSVDEAMHFMLDQNYSRFPLYDDDVDNVIGVLHLKDVMKAYLENPDLLLSKIAQEAFFVHETQGISSLFKDMQKKKIHMAIVIDEYGQTAGIVAMEDILEEIVGNILDEHDEEEKEIIKLKKTGEYMVRGLTRLDHITDALGIEFPDEDIDTLNGFLIWKIGRLPVDHEELKVNYQGYQFRTLDIHDKMIVQVKITKLDNEDEK